MKLGLQMEWGPGLGHSQLHQGRDGREGGRTEGGEKGTISVLRLKHQK